MLPITVIDNINMELLNEFKKNKICYFQFYVKTRKFCNK